MEAQIAQMILNVLNKPLDYRIIIELKSTHQCWGGFKMNDYYMIDKSDGENVFDNFTIYLNNDKDNEIRAEVKSFSNLYFFILGMLKSGKVSEIYNECF